AGTLDGGQVRVGAARQPGVVPVAAPLDDVALHVVEAPRVGRVAADLGVPLQGRTFLGAVIRLVALEIRLFTADFVAGVGGRRGACPAGVLPLRLGGQPELPALGQLPGAAAQFGQLAAERLGLGVVDVVDGEVVALAAAGRQLARQLTQDAFPL